jgi:hypothetical protein
MNERFPWLPPLKEIERNASLHLVTTSLALDGPLALLPNQVPIAGLGLMPPQPLPKVSYLLRYSDKYMSIVYRMKLHRNNTIRKNDNNTIE